MKCAEIVASSLTWEQAHVNVDSAVKGLAPELRGRRPDGLPYPVWELVEHIRIALADFTTANVAMLTEKIPAPRGTGQTFLRTVLVAMDHTSHHVGQIIAVRRLLGAWKAGK